MSAVVWDARAEPRGVCVTLAAGEINILSWTLAPQEAKRLGHLILDAVRQSEPTHAELVRQAIHRR